MLEISNLNKSFGELRVLKDINLKVDKGEIVSIIGPSGTGKSTLLRCINFLEQPNSGTIRISDTLVDSNNYKIKEIQELRMKSSMVFQNYALFRNKTVLENVMMPMTVVRNIDYDTAKEQAYDLIEQVGLTVKMNQYPSRLSGGQQQRIGIARALAARPDILLLDEPTSSLDPELVGGVLEIVSELAERHEATMLIVTHEMNFAMKISDRIVYMNGGTIIEEGSPEEILTNEGFENTRRFLKVFDN